jgi:transposase
MTIIGGLDIHRAQITFDYLDTETGEVSRGRIEPATRLSLRRWLGERFTEVDGDGVKLAVEGCTGWRYVVEEMQRLGVEPHLAEPAETASRRGSKKRAKTDKADAFLLRDLLCQGRLPESYIPPVHMLEVRNLGRLYQALSKERRSWLQRIQAQLYHQGVAGIGALLSCEGRAELEQAGLSASGRQMVQTALAMLQALDQQLQPLRAQLKSLSRSLPGARALMAHYGIGPLTAVVIWAEMGDCRRLRNSGQAVRLAGLDVTVYASAGKRAAGKLARQGSPMLRWALFEAAKSSAKRTAPEHAYYQSVDERLNGKRASISVARKLARQCYHTLRELGDEGLAPAEESAAQAG